jgi:hypothetical protein
LIPDLPCGLLGCDEGVREQFLAPLQVTELRLERMNLVRQFAAVAPHVFEAVGDIVEEVLDGTAPIATEK